jgi:filamentous hemagglutinin
MAAFAPGGVVETLAGGAYRSFRGAQVAERLTPAAEAAVSLNVDVDMLAHIAERVPTSSGGYFNVVTHADPNVAWVLKGGEWTSVSHRSLARFIQGSEGYSGGPVRLIACEAGACASGLGQNLANKLGIEVLAPTEKAFVDFNGSFWTSGTWRSFAPGGP